VSTVIVRPRVVVDALEAMNLRDTFTRVLAGGGTGVVVDLTGVHGLSAAGLAAVTNLVGQGGRIGIPVRVLLPAEGSAAARVIDQADLRRFLAPGGTWNRVANERVDARHADGGPGMPRVHRVRDRIALWMRPALRTVATSAN
jgi:anti-anti-sigma regulatory factor